MEKYLEAAVGVLFTLWLAAVTFFGRRELDRLDRKADGKSLEDTLALLRSHIDDDKELRKDLTERMDAAVRALSETREHVARISGKLGL